MNTFAHRALGFFLLSIPCLAQEPPPAPSPPSRHQLEDQLKATRLKVNALQDHVHEIEEVVDDKEEAVRDATDRLDKTKDSLLEYQNLLAEHETNAGDPDLTPAQRREYARAIRATRAHLKKLESIRVQEVETLRLAEEDVQRAKAGLAAENDRLVQLRIRADRLLATLRSLPAGQ